MTDVEKSLEGVQIAVEGNEEEKNLPHYPEGLLPINDELDPPKFEGDMDNMTERLRFKVFQVWNTWSSLHMNETLVKKLKLSKDDSDDVQYIKACIVLLLDRLGKILSNTEIVPEMTPSEVDHHHR